MWNWSVDDRSEVNNYYYGGACGDWCACTAAAISQRSPCNIYVFG